MDVYDGTLPGTAKTQAEQGEKGFAKIELLLEATGGLSLSQVCVVTGLEASTIQNWVKRGWVSHPIGKRYEEVHIARILIINALKDCIKLEHIAMLMTYLNGKAKDGSEAIIKESTLYNYLCEAMKRSGQMGDSSKGGVESVVDTVIKDYTNKDPEARAKLRKTLTLMMFACVCTDVKRRTEAMMGQILKELDAKVTVTPKAKPVALPVVNTAITPTPIQAAHAAPAAPVAPAVAAPVAPVAPPVVTAPIAPAVPVAPVAPAVPVTPVAPIIPPAAPPVVPVAPVAPPAAPVVPRQPAPPQPVTPIRITLDDPEPPKETPEEAAQTRKTISQALREWDISSVEKIIIDHDEEARKNAEAEPEPKKPVNRPWYIRKNKEQ